MKAENTVTYFAPAGTKIAGVQVEAGDVVKSGDMMVCFDEAALAYAQRQSDLEQKISATDYTAAVQTNQEQQAKLAQAQTDMPHWRFRRTIMRVHRGPYQWYYGCDCPA